MTTPVATIQAMTLKQVADLLPHTVDCWEPEAVKGFVAHSLRLMLSRQSHGDNRFVVLDESGTVYEFGPTTLEQAKAYDDQLSTSFNDYQIVEITDVPAIPSGLVDAIQLALELARSNLAPDEPDTEHIRQAQIDALNLLEDFAANHLGDD